MIVEHGVTHMCGAPTVLNMLVSAPAEQRRRFNHIVDIQTGGSPPPAKVIKGMEELGFRVTHIYGMTELQGPSTLCVPQDSWADLPLEERATFSARQGVRYPVVDGQMVRSEERRVGKSVVLAAWGMIIERVGCHRVWECVW